MGVFSDDMAAIQIGLPAFYTKRGETSAANSAWKDVFKREFGAGFVIAFTGSKFAGAKPVLVVVPDFVCELLLHVHHACLDTAPWRSARFAADVPAGYRYAG